MTIPISIRADAKDDFNIWSHSLATKNLYQTRANDSAPEMTCAAQAAEILMPILKPGDSLLDAGCGAGHFYHSLRHRDIEVSYIGVDATADYIKIGRQELSGFGLCPDNLICSQIEDLDGTVDVSVCMNVLSNIGNYHKPLERLLKMSRKAVLIRESICQKSSYNYVTDNYLDDDVDLKVHMNNYGEQELIDFVKSYGFKAKFIIDKHTNGKPEQVIGHPVYWTFMLAEVDNTKVLNR